MTCSDGLCLWCVVISASLGHVASYVLLLRGWCNRVVTIWPPCVVWRVRGRCWQARGGACSTPRPLPSRGWRPQHGAAAHVAVMSRLCGVPAATSVLCPWTLGVSRALDAGGAALPTRAAFSTARALPWNGRASLRSLQTCLMVDKTALLARILTEDDTGTEPFLIATAPRRFGKSFVVKQLAALARWDDADKRAFAGYAVRAHGLYQCRRHAVWITL